MNPRPAADDASPRAAGDHPAGRVAAVMMQKNETELLPYWLAYYGELFGPDALVIFDNGSDDPAVRDILADAARRGATVRYDCADAEAFRNKGLLALEAMRKLRRKGFDFFFPLDCDEFVAVERDGAPSIDPAEIAAEIDRCRAHRVNHIAAGWTNHPARPNFYTRQAFAKVFGRFTVVRQLGTGYHGVPFPTAPSSIAYIHYHCRPYAELVARSAAKVRSHGRELDRAALAAFVASGAPGHKSAMEILMGEAQYLANLDRRPYEAHPALGAWFEAHLGRLPFQRGPVPSPQSARSG